MTKPKLRGPHKERTGKTRAALLEAALGLIAERGLRGFSAAEVEVKGGVGRGLAVFHFGTASTLVSAAVEAAFASIPQSSTMRGLEGLRAWWNDLQCWLDQHPRSAATILHVLLTRTNDAVTAAVVERYRMMQTEAVRNYLSQLAALRQLSDGIDPKQGAAFVLDQLHGCWMRQLAGAGASSDTLVLIEAALVRSAPPTPTTDTQKAGKGAEQQKLF